MADLRSFSYLFAPRPGAFSPGGSTSAHRVVYSLKRSLLVICALLCAFAGPATAAAQANTQFAPSASEVTVYLLTMGQGDPVWEKFGHDALWVHDPIRGTDQVYNYGVFDFHS